MQQETIRELNFEICLSNFSRDWVELDVTNPTQRELDLISDKINELYPDKYKRFVYDMTTQRICLFKLGSHIKITSGDITYA